MLAVLPLKIQWINNSFCHWWKGYLGDLQTSLLSLLCCFLALADAVFYYLIHTVKKANNKMVRIRWLKKGEKKSSAQLFKWFVFHSHSSVVCLPNVLKLGDMKLQAPCAWNNLKWLYQRFASLYSTCEYSASYTETRDSGWSRISSSFLSLTECGKLICHQVC